MSIRQSRYASAVATLLVAVSLAPAQSNLPLRLEKTIPLPGVKGRIDHLSFDADNQRLFVAALGNNTVERERSRYISRKIPTTTPGLPSLKP
jgi:hypothetical protein